MRERNTSCEHLQNQEEREEEWSVPGTLQWSIERKETLNNRKIEEMRVNKKMRENLHHTYPRIGS